MVLARELTKTFETFLDGDAASLLARMEADPDQARGEFVVMVAGASPKADDDEALVEAETLLKALLAEGVGVKQAAAITVRLLGRHQEGLVCQRPGAQGRG